MHIKKEVREDLKMQAGLSSQCMYDDVYFFGIRLSQIICYVSGSVLLACINIVCSKPPRSSSAHIHLTAGQPMMMSVTLMMAHIHVRLLLYRDGGIEHACMCLFLGWI